MKKISKVLTLFFTFAIALSMFCVTAMADGSYSVDTTYLVLREGQSATITISADNAAGRVDWSGSGAVSASGSAYLDNGVATIEVYANAAGTGTISVVPTDIATYDNEEITYGYTINVEVIGDGNAEPAPAEPDVPQEQPEPDAPQDPLQPEEETTTQPEDQAPLAEGEVLTDGNNDYEGLSEEERLYTSVDGQELYIIRYPHSADENRNTVWNDEVYGLDNLAGFELTTVNYKGMNVDAFSYKDQILAFVLKNLETDESRYYTLGANGEGFIPLSYITANGKTYIVVDFPSDFVIPEGYEMVEMTLGKNKVQALRKTTEGGQAEPSEPQTESVAEPSLEESVNNEAEGEGLYSGESSYSLRTIIDPRTRVMLKGYETVISPGLDTKDPSSDLYYIYCLVDGDTQLYSYDSVEGTLQRASIVVYNEVPTEPETVIIYETLPAAETVADNSGSLLKGIGWNNMQIQMKVLLIALAVAILLIIVLIILFAVMSRKNKKASGHARNRNAEARNQGRRDPGGRDQRPYRSRPAPRGEIPPRTNRSSSSIFDDEESFFSYVKTENKDEFDFESLK